MRTGRTCKKFGEKIDFCEQDKEKVVQVISTFPKGVNMSPLHAEAIGLFCVFSIVDNLPDCDIVWIRRLQRYAKMGQLILRPILVADSDYINHLSAISDWRGEETISRKCIAALKQTLKCKWLWVIEISVPELYSATQRKIGEVLIKASEKICPENFFQSYLMSRIPGYFVFGEEKELEKYVYDFLPNEITGHTGIFMHPTIRTVDQS
jgi:hypothetical protein